MPSANFQASMMLKLARKPKLSSVGKPKPFITTALRLKLKGKSGPHKFSELTGEKNTMNKKNALLTCQL